MSGKIPARSSQPAVGTGRGALRDLHILVVEDEYLLADELCGMLADEGATIIGPAPRVDAALELLDREPRPSLAVLDVNLQGRTAWPVADALLARGIPFVFLTGYDPAAIPRAYAHVPRAGKPVQLQELLPLIRAALG